MLTFTLLFAFTWCALLYDPLMYDNANELNEIVSLWKLCKHGNLSGSLGRATVQT